MSLEPSFECWVRPEGYLRFADIEKVIEYIEAGDLCLLPSDSAYVLTGLFTVEGVTDDLDAILDRRGLAMSLAFGSFRKAEAFAELSPKARLFMRELTPGGLTFVAKASGLARAGFARTRLHAPGTLGVRLTESRVETQLAYELDQPLTTTPVRDPDGHELVEANEALDHVLPRLAAMASRRRLAVIHGTVAYPRRLSTVVAETTAAGLPQLRVLRQGAIELSEITAAARRCQYEDVEVVDP